MINSIEIMVNGGGQIDGLRPLKQKDKLEYHECTRMLLDIGSQIEILKENGWGVLYLSVRDISIANDGTYIITPTMELFSCDEKGMILLDRPFTYHKTYMAPELKDITTLPSKVYYTCVYFSLKQLALDVLGIDTISRIYPTKLYFLIERCSEEDPKERIFLFI